MIKIFPLNPSLPYYEKVSLKALDLRLRRIKALRSLMIGAAMLIGAAFLFAAMISILMPKGNLGKDLIQGDDLVLSKPRFVGHSASGGKVVITAEGAKRTLGKNNANIELKNPKMESSEGAIVIAKTGVWNQENQELLLNKDVVFTRKSGETITGQSAFWDNVSDTLSMSQSVRITQKSGETIECQKLVYDNKSGNASASGGVTIFANKVTAYSNNLYVNINEKYAKGNGNVQISMPMGVASSDSYVYYSLSRRAILRGNARVIFNNSK